MPSLPFLPRIVTRSVSFKLQSSKTQRHHTIFFASTAATTSLASHPSLALCLRLRPHRTLHTAPPPHVIPFSQLRSHIERGTVHPCSTLGPSPPECANDSPKTVRLITFSLLSPSPTSHPGLAACRYENTVRASPSASPKSFPKGQPPSTSR